jgi:hypothetical protein
MELDKQEIVNMLRERGDHSKAQKAEQELPDKVDDEQHSDLLQRIGIDSKEPLGKIGL